MWLATVIVTATADLPPPRHPAREIVNHLRLAVHHLPVRHDDATVQAARLATVTRVNVIRDLKVEEEEEEQEQEEEEEEDESPMRQL